MALSHKKLLRKKQKKRSKHKKSQTSSDQRQQAYARLPIKAAWLTADIQERGIGIAVFVRQISPDRYMICSYLNNVN